MSTQHLALPLQWAPEAAGPSTSYRWLVPAVTVSGARLETGPEGFLRSRAAGVVSGALTLRWLGRPPGHLKHVLLGESEWTPGSIPPSETCEIADGISHDACVDGFTQQVCGCEEGETELRFTRVVEAGELVQVAALPFEYGASSDELESWLTITHRPGGWCDFLGDESTKAPTPGDAEHSHAHAACGAHWDGMALSEGGAGCYTEVARQALDGRIEIASSGCHASPVRNDAPFLYETVPAGAPFAATVRVLQSTDVQWSAGGLMVTRAGAAGGASADPATDWVALLSAQSRELTLQGASGGVAAVAHRLPQLPSAAWLRLNRSADGSLSAWWRASSSDAWIPFGAPFALEGFDGAVRVGVTHHSSSVNVGAVSLDAFSLETDGLRSRTDEPQACCNTWAGPADAWHGRAPDSRDRVSPLLLVVALLVAVSACFRRPPPAADVSLGGLDGLTPKPTLSRGRRMRKGGLPTFSAAADDDETHPSPAHMRAPQRVRSMADVNQTVGSSEDLDAPTAPVAEPPASGGLLVTTPQPQRASYSRLPEEGYYGGGFGTPLDGRRRGFSGSPPDSRDSRRRSFSGNAWAQDASSAAVISPRALFSTSDGATYAEINLGGSPGGSSYGGSSYGGAVPTAAGPILLRLAAACSWPSMARSAAGFGGAENSSATGYVTLDEADQVEITLPELR